jgi:hypothetical protein
MSDAERKEQVARDSIVILLSDEENARVSTGEAASRLAEEAECRELEHLDQGVQHAKAATAKTTMGPILPRSAVIKSLWRTPGVSKAARRIDAASPPADDGAYLFGWDIARGLPIGRRDPVQPVLPGWCAWFLIASLITAVPLQLPSGNAVAEDKKPDECGLASIYASVSEETASGEDTRAENLTAAHRSLPFGTLVEVENQENGRSAVMRITDRGPFVSGRIIDVSQVAARELGFSGLTQVCLTILVIPENPSGGG